jgi:hypothetical protein
MTPHPSLPFERPRTRWAVVAALLAMVGLAISARPADASVPARIRGDVVSFATDRAVGGAVVSLPAFALSVRSGPDGSFAFPQARPARYPYRAIEASVTAPGFGTWTVRGLPLYPNDTLVLHAELRARPFLHVVPPAGSEGAAGPGRGSKGITGNTCSGWDYQLVPPETIRVWISDEGVSKEYDFVFYVRHVLPREWIPSWDADSLGAGAVAARSYGAWKAMSGHAYSEGPNCADVIDTVSDQIFDPTYSTAATDQATYATFGSILYRDGGIFITQYYAGYPGQACAPVEGEFEGRMSQWGTKTCADGGMLWDRITTTFYVGSYWNYLRNLVLNPSVSSPAMYPWNGDGNTDFSRVQGTGYDGSWYLRQSPTEPGPVSTVYQHHAFNGTPSTQYQAAAALRCPSVPENDERCNVVIRVTAYTDGGSSISRGKMVKVPSDGQWRFYTFGPQPHGITHSSVRLSILTAETLHVDAAWLSAGFGGP